MTTDWGKMRYGWSKYGGPMYGLVREEQSWHCQCCGKEQPKTVPQYMMPLDGMNRDFVRICSICKHRQTHGNMSYHKLVVIVRHL